MVISSMLLSSSQSEYTPFPSSFFDHTYSKNSNMSGNPLPMEAADVSMFPQTPDIVKENGAQTETSCSSKRLVNCHNSNQESQMICDFDFDDLDLSLSDFDMETESGANGSFQEFVDTALSLSSSADASVTSGSASSFAANMGREETRSFALSSVFTSDSMCLHNTPSLMTQTEAPYSRTFPSEDFTSQSQSQTPIPTKNFSCSDIEGDGSVLCVYSSCQRDETTLSSSTSRTKLKPGDYLPPLYIDTQNYGNLTDSSLPFQEGLSERVSPDFPPEQYPIASGVDNQLSNPSVHVSSLSTSTTTTSASATMCNGSSCVLTPLSLTDLSHSNAKKSSGQQEKEMEELSDSCLMETPSDQFGDSVEDLDLESVTDLKKYLSEAKLDLRTLDTPFSEHSSFSTSACSCYPQCKCDSQTSTHQRSSDKSLHEKDTNTLSVSGLRLSILDDFSSKHDLISWIDTCAFDETPTPPISPGLSPDWRKTTDVHTTRRTSKHETNILDFFSDDNAHAFFLSDDSAVCQMHVSQFI
ncbi:hypothetical protein EGW08_005538 [Elysia chlorotica]|uniref:Uncharacterized protein n=1 Tax=Elysia chlorotica TaxID=188477 RepID=A0A433TYK5_ELYCH|nr:hypothetical protein EGW08_005538 [Elysia chlorotica]